MHDLLECKINGRKYPKKQFFPYKIEQKKQIKMQMKLVQLIGHLIYS